MIYEFDQSLNRRGTNALKTDGFRQFLLKEYADLQLPYADEELVSMWIADMDFATAPEIMSALAERMEHPIFGYTKLLSPSYIEAFQSWCERQYGWQPQAETVVTSNGIVPALHELIAHLCSGDEKVVIFTPSYGYFKRAADYHHVDVISIPLHETAGDYTIDFATFAQVVARVDVKLCIFCHPHNPTGRVWTEAELQRVGELCFANDVWLISDEIHGDLLRNGVTHTPMAKLFPNEAKLITCMAPSKTFNLAGMNMSNVIIEDVALRTRWLERHLAGTNALSAVATEAAYREGDAWLAALKTYLDDNFTLLETFLNERLPRAVFKRPDATYLAWVRLDAYVPVTQDYTLFFADRAGVLLEGGNRFVANGDGYVRLNVACPRHQLQEALERIARALVSEPTA